MKAFWPLLCLLLVSCLYASEHHEELDSRVGRIDESALQLEVFGADGSGRAAVHDVQVSGSPWSASLWAAAPRLSARIRGASEPIVLTIANVLPAAELRLDGVVIPREVTERPTLGRWTLPAVDDGMIVVESPDADELRPHTVAVLSDIQDAVDDVHEIFERMNEDAPLYVISTGDLSSNGRASELEAIMSQLEVLEVPFYSTVGNHEVPGPEIWHALFGPFSTFFVQHGVAVSLVDSSNATIDPSLYQRVVSFADEHRDRAHLWLTHVPLMDASGLRSGAFSSRNEAARTLQMLADHEVDALFFGHVHSFYAYELAGVPTYISGGGGAVPERLDGIDRHYLLVDLVPDDPDPVAGVSLVRVD